MNKYSGQVLPVLPGLLPALWVYLLLAPTPHPCMNKSGAMGEGGWPGCWTLCCPLVRGGLCSDVLHPPDLLASWLTSWLVGPMAHLAHLSCLSPAGSVDADVHLFDVSVHFLCSKVGPPALNPQPPSAFPGGSVTSRLFLATLKPRGIGVGRGEVQGTSAVPLPG